MVGPEDLGDITVNDNVVALYASIALTEVEGVVTVSGKSTFTDYVGVKSKDVERGVTVNIDKATSICTITVELNITYGFNVYDTARKIQRAVKNAIESYTGLTVDKVNVMIKEVVVIEQPRATGKTKAA
jgi:uncharacterized alkaline shock family protein YloU